ncbi:hypothetical protein E4U55_007479 [Claviceps digitariae]|nr:hypothetical protein E4U55_007479 [Claviceps digitariae]
MLDEVAVVRSPLYAINRAEYGSRTQRGLVFKALSRESRDFPWGFLPRGFRVVHSPGNTSHGDFYQGEYSHLRNAKSEVYGNTPIGISTKGSIPISPLHKTLYSVTIASQTRTSHPCKRADELLDAQVG